jgi:hypothetical protein
MPAVRAIDFNASETMRSEAQFESGLTRKEYANAHGLLTRRMRRDSRACLLVTPSLD